MIDKKKILLIDDDEDFLMATRLILERGGYEVIVADSGKTGIEKADSITPDLIIVDMMMETWSEGFNVVSRLRSRECGRERTPMIMLSAVDLMGPYQAFEPTEDTPSVDLVLHKPITAHALLHHVEVLMH